LKNSTPWWTKSSFVMARICMIQKRWQTKESSMFAWEDQFLQLKSQP